MRDSFSSETGYEVGSAPWMLTKERGSVNFALRTAERN